MQRSAADAACLTSSVICLTGFESKEKEDLYLLIDELGGKYSHDLTGSTTHLVASASGSAKYRAALSWGIPVITSAWLLACQRNKTRVPIDTFTLKVFTGLVICTTGLYQDVKDEIEAMVSANGGEYMGNLETERTTHLIAQEAVGAKYDVAIEVGIPVVRLEWIAACVEANALLEEGLYSLPQSQVVEEVLEQPPPQPQLVVATAESMLARVDAVFEAVNNMSSYLEECAIFFYGVDDTELLQKLVKIVRRGGGTRFSQCHASVTHIVTGPAMSVDTAASLSSFKSTADCADVVSIMWLLESCTYDTLQDESLYPGRYEASPVLRKHRVEEPEDIVIDSTAVAVLGDTATTPLTIVPAEDNSVTTTTTRRRKLSMTNRIKLEHSFLLVAASTESVPSKLEQEIQSRGGYTDTFFCNTIGVNQLKMLEHKSFAFVLVTTGCVLLPDVQEAIEACFPKAKFATEMWLRCTLRDNRLYSRSSHPFFRNLQVRYNVNATLCNKFSNIVASVSNYVHAERAVCIELLTLLTASHTKKFSRRNTHLICLKPAGPKYEKALEWGLTIVTIQWLLHCVTTGQYADPSEFDVHDDGITSPPSTPPSSSRSVSSFEKNPSVSKQNAENVRPKAASCNPGHFTQLENLLEEMDGDSPADSSVFGATCFGTTWDKKTNVDEIIQDKVTSANSNSITIKRKSVNPNYFDPEKDSNAASQWIAYEGPIEKKLRRTLRSSPTK